MDFGRGLGPRDPRHPREQLGCRHAVHDSIVADTSPAGRSDAELEKRQLAACVSVGPDRDSHPDLAGQFEQLSVKLLTVWIAVDLACPVRLAGKFEYPLRGGMQAEAEIEDAAQGMSQDVNARVAKRHEVALCLVLGPAEPRMKGFGSQAES